uniref:Uncharacterized protein n=1 Tax=Loigolactobacillus rennini TaxID=238013 RepID=A0A1K2I8U5_9LACO|nr:hypothetical protein LREN565_1940 [Loigolactobacillus rennini]
MFFYEKLIYADTLTRTTALAIKAKNAFLITWQALYFLLY